MDSSKKHHGASVSSTLGDVPGTEVLRSQLRSLVLRSPSSWQGKPCVTLGLVGFKGSAKSTFINTLLGICSGGPNSVSRNFSGTESDNSTTENRLIPLHQALFGTADPPAYLWIWDTVGIPHAANKVWTGLEVNTAVGQLVQGTLRVGSRELGAVDNTPIVSGMELPIQALLVCQHAAVHLPNLSRCRENESEASFLKLLAGIGANWGYIDGAPSWFQGFPVYSILTCFDTILPEVFDEKTGSDVWARVASEPKVVATMRYLAMSCRIPYSRCYVTFGLDSLRPTGQGLNVRELSVLLPVLNATREAVVQDNLRNEERKVLLQRQNRVIPQPSVKKNHDLSLMYMDHAQLCSYFAKLELKAASQILEQQRVSGMCLISMTDNEIDELFQKSEHFGECFAIRTMVRPYRELQSTNAMAPTAPSFFGEGVEGIAAAAAATATRQPPRTIGDSMSSVQCFPSVSRSSDEEDDNPTKKHRGSLVLQALSTADTPNNQEIPWHNVQTNVAEVVTCGNGSAQFTLKLAGTYEIWATFTHYADSNNNQTNCYFELLQNGSRLVWQRSNASNSNYYQSHVFYHCSKFAANTKLSFRFSNPHNYSVMSASSCPARLYVKLLN